MTPDLSPGRARLRRLLSTLAVWSLLAAVSSGAIWNIDRQTGLAELETESASLLRLASQRADQHDAHLTALSAVATAAGAEETDLFLDVADTILRFYPRIVAIDLVPLTENRKVTTTRPEASEQIAEVVRAAALASTGALEVRASPLSAGTYLLVKRSPNTSDAVYGLALEIDAAALIAPERDFWDGQTTTMGLRLPGGRWLVGDDRALAAQFTRPLSSASQPLVLETSVTGGLTGASSLGRIASMIAVMTLFYVAALVTLSQILKRRHAEQRARLSAQDARLAHATRVNALGELASAMAHELTQPLTAILAQGQAGRRLMQRGDTIAVTQVLDETVAQARRASEILDRLRRWTSPARARSTRTSVNAAARSVEALLGPEARRRHIDLSLDLAPDLMPVHADPVELEQVIFNLTRNAIDAVADAAERRITLATRAESNVVVLEVGDTGPGVPEALRPRIFEPFVTGRTDGTGLGLALCQRLVDRMEGEIALVPSQAGALFRLRLRPALAQQAAAQ